MAQSLIFKIRPDLTKNSDMVGKEKSRRVNTHNTLRAAGK
jgi:hypothetical protein